MQPEARPYQSIPREIRLHQSMERARNTHPHFLKPRCRQKRKSCCWWKFARDFNRGKPATPRIPREIQPRQSTGRSRKTQTECSECPQWPGIVFVEFRGNFTISTQKLRRPPSTNLNRQIEGAALKCPRSGLKISPPTESRTVRSLEMPTTVCCPHIPNGHIANLSLRIDRAPLKCLDPFLKTFPPTNSRSVCSTEVVTTVLLPSIIQWPHHISELLDR